MSQPLASIERFVFGSTPMHGMIVLRIFLGAAFAGAYGMRTFEYDLLFGSDSVAWFGPYRSWVANVIAPTTGLVMEPVVSATASLGASARDLLCRGLLGAVILCGTGFAVGFRTRVCGVIGLLIHLFFLALNPLAYWSWAHMIVPFFAYAIASPANRYFALDGWLARRRSGAGPSDASAQEDWVGSAWTLRLVQLHVCLMYGYSGLARIDHPGWLAGHMLYEAMTNEAFSRFAINWYPVAPVLEWVSYGIFVLEPAALVLLWLPRTRTACALLLIAMHTVLEFGTQVGYWNFVMLGGLATFLPPAWLQRGFEWLGNRRGASAEIATPAHPSDPPSG